MAAIRETGKINENTTLIDIGMFGVSGSTAIYLASSFFVLLDANAFSHRAIHDVSVTTP